MRSYRQSCFGSTRGAAGQQCGLSGAIEHTRRPLCGGRGRGTGRETGAATRWTPALSSGAPGHHSSHAAEPRAWFGESVDGVPRLWILGGGRSRVLNNEWPPRGRPFKPQLFKRSCLRTALFQEPEKTEPQRLERPQRPRLRHLDDPVRSWPLQRSAAMRGQRNYRYSKHSLNAPSLGHDRK